MFDFNHNTEEYRDMNDLDQKLEKIGLPTYGTQEEKLKRARLHGLLSKDEILSQVNTLERKILTVDVPESPRRGRPARK